MPKVAVYVYINGPLWLNQRAGERSKAISGLSVVQRLPLKGQMHTFQLFQLVKKIWIYRKNPDNNEGK